MYKEKRFADEKVTVPFPRFLGYHKVKHGEFIVNGKENEVTRYVYKLIIDGLSVAMIAKILTEREFKILGRCDKFVRNY